MQTNVMLRYKIFSGTYTRTHTWCKVHGMSWEKSVVPEISLGTWMVKTIATWRYWKALCIKNARHLRGAVPHFWGWWTLYLYIYTYIHTYIHAYIHPCIHTWHDMTWHDMTLHYITLHYNHYITSTQHRIASHRIASHRITLPYLTLHYITLHYITLHTYIHVYTYTFNIIINIYIYIHIYSSMSGIHFITY